MASSSNRSTRKFWPFGKSHSTEEMPGMDGSADASDEVSQVEQLRVAALHWVITAWYNVRDWMILITLSATLVAMEITPGLVERRYITDEALQHIMYPDRPHTVPTWVIPILNFIGIPLAITIHSTWMHKPAGLHYYAFIGSVAAVLLTGNITELFKIEVGRPRPNFFFNCFPDGVPQWRELGIPGQREPICSPDAGDVEDSYQSFPSGHASWSMASMLFLSLYCYHFGSRRGGIHSMFGLTALLTPPMVAMWIAATRVVDYHHHVTDVVAGLGIGAVVAVLTFYTYFPWGEGPVLNRSGVAIVRTVSEVVPDHDALPRRRNAQASVSWTDQNGNSPARLPV